MKGSKRKGRRPGTWELRVDAGPDPLTRKRQQKSATFIGSSRDADVALAALVTDASRGNVAVGTRTVADAIEAGLRQAKLEGLEPTTIARLPDGGGQPPVAGARFEAADASDRRASRPLLWRAGRGRTTRARRCAAVTCLVCRVLDQAQRWGWVATNVGRDARPPRQHTSNPKPVPIDMARAMIDEAAKVNPTLATLMVLAADTGARRGELCALRWRHLDEEAGTLRIEAAIGETNVVYEKDTKTHQHRTVTLSSFALGVAARAPRPPRQGVRAVRDRAQRRRLRVGARARRPEAAAPIERVTGVQPAARPDGAAELDPSPRPAPPPGHAAARRRRAAAQRVGPSRSPEPVDHHEHLRPLDPGVRRPVGGSRRGPNLGSRQMTRPCDRPVGASMKWCRGAEWVTSE